MRFTLFLATSLVLSQFGYLTLALSASDTAASGLPKLLRWRARENGFMQWEHRGTAVLKDGALVLSAGASETADGTVYGEATSPVVEQEGFAELVPSWNVETPENSWIDVDVQVRVNGVWQEWRSFGTWTSSSAGLVKRASSGVEQGDTLLDVVVDTLLLRGTARADAARIRLRLLSTTRGMSPRITAVGVTLSEHPTSQSSTSPGNSEAWDSFVSLPACSQMLYPDGGEAWCSPTSVAMVLGYWQQQAGLAPGACSTSVYDAVSGVYDYVYNGYGNWPFNVAYTTTIKTGKVPLEGYVIRLRDLEEAERWTTRGVPLVVSFGWTDGELDGAPLPSSRGHLAVLAGFDTGGNPVVYDPAGVTNAQVPRTYRRDQFERLWLAHSAGTAYVIAPPEYFDLSPALYLPAVTQ